jgi:hypothetical protein
MARFQFLSRYTSPWCVLLAAIAASATGADEQSANGVAIWDSGSYPADRQDAGRAGWKLVPTELFRFEAEPAKAASDPGYYGREYSFQGDAVVESQRLLAVFSRISGSVTLYAIDSTPGAPGAARPAGLGRRIVELALPARDRPVTISGLTIVRNAGDEAALEVAFSTAGSAPSSALFVVDRTGVVEVRPSEGMTGVRLRAPIEYGVAPGFIGDDLIYGPSSTVVSGSLSVPAENLFLGLLRGEESELVMTWPKGGQKLRLERGTPRDGASAFESIAFEPAGERFFLAALAAPGIWHKEALRPAFLEKEVAISWTKPFPARWKTQLLEANVRTTYRFRETKGQVWRGVPGSYTYPVWFDGDKAFFHLSKKVPPKGESLIYFVEPQGTPLEQPTPADILKATLGRQASDTILDMTGRRLRTHHRRGGDGVHRACTCGCTEAIQSVFEAGEEVNQRSFVCEAVDDMVYFVRCHVERIEEYQRFANEMIQFLEAGQGSSPDLKPYVASLLEVVQQIPQEYSAQKENMKSLEYAEQLTRRTIALTQGKSSGNLAAFMELLKDWRGMGGSQDYVLAHCHMVTRKLSQEAGYGCAEVPAALALAEEVRSRCRRMLRNPDGYEIWADY